MTHVATRLIAIAAMLLACTAVVAQEQNQDGSKNRFYRGLDNGIQFYQQIADQGGWPTVPSGPALKVGSSDPRVAILRERLGITGDYLGEDSDSPLFDEALKEGVVAFQNRNGLEPDGAVGPGTLKTLNIPVQDRIATMGINRTRWDTMPAALGERFVLVNMAGFELNVIEGETSVMNMRVIVGKDYHSTPMFSDTITTIELNPYWNVPASIANGELVPTYVNGTAKAEAQGFEVVDGDNVQPVSAVNWSQYASTEIPFRIRQRPGPSNALGEMKFMFPNKHNVYLHDTNQRSLFAKTVRAFSHGCVRVQKPYDLAGYLLQRNGDWPQARIGEVVASKEHTVIQLADPVPVHLAYMTAWMDQQGLLQFRPDIYGRDAELAGQIVQ